MVVHIRTVVNIVKADQQVVVRRFDMARLIGKAGQVPILDCFHKTLVELLLTGTLTNQFVERISLVKELLPFLEKFNASGLQRR